MEPLPKQSPPPPTEPPSVLPYGRPDPDGRTTFIRMTMSGVMILIGGVLLLWLLKLLAGDSYGRGVDSFMHGGVLVSVIVLTMYLAVRVRRSPNESYQKEPWYRITRGFLIAIVLILIGVGLLAAGVCYIVFSGFGRP